MEKNYNYYDFLVYEPRYVNQGRDERRKLIEFKNALKFSAVILSILGLVFLILAIGGC